MMMPDTNQVYLTNNIQVSGQSRLRLLLYSTLHNETLGFILYGLLAMYVDEQNYKHPYLAWIGLVLSIQFVRNWLDFNWGDRQDIYQSQYNRILGLDAGYAPNVC